MMRKIVHFLAVIVIIGIPLSLMMVPVQADTQHGLSAKYYALSDINTILISRIDPQVALTYNDWARPNNGIAETFKYVPSSSGGAGTPYGATWSGYLEIPESGTYTFGGITDDWGGAQLYISDKWVDIVYWHSSWLIYPAQRSRDHSGGNDKYDPLTISLTKGFYPISATMQEIDGLGEGGFDLDWKRPGQTQWEVVPQEFLCPDSSCFPVIPVVSNGCGNWYIYLVIGLILGAVVLAYLVGRRLVRPKVDAAFKVEDINKKEMLICNIWNVKRSQIDDLIAYFEILNRADMQIIGKTVRAKITTKPGEIEERVASPVSHAPARFPVVVFNQEINAAYIASDSKEQMSLLPVGTYVVNLKIYFGRQVKQVAQEFTVVSESPHIRLFYSIDKRSGD